jgi:hypothetical protein
MAGREPRRTVSTAAFADTLTVHLFGMLWTTREGLGQVRTRYTCGFRILGSSMEQYELLPTLCG